MTAEQIVRIDDYNVHFGVPYAGSLIVEYKVFPVQDWENVSTKVKGTSYIDATSPSEDMLDQFDKDKAKWRFQGSCCYRGVWETRVYFSDDEYWGEEFVEMHTAYNKIIEECKRLIVIMHPEYKEYMND